MRFLLCGVALFSAHTLCAQQPITITSDNVVQNKPGNYLAWDVVNSTTIPQGGENQVWDYSEAKKTGTYTFFNCVEANASELPTATYARFSKFSLKNYEIKGGAYHEVNSTGDHHIGNSYEETILDLGAGVLHIPAQVIRISENNTRLQLPTTYQSSWRSTASVAIQAQLTVPSAGLDNAPFTYVQTGEAHDTIMGWGTLKLPGAIELEVLLAKRTYITLDSFFLMGQPAPAMLLAAFGVQQGGTNTTEEYNFFALGINDNVMELNVEGGNVRASYRQGLSTTDVGTSLAQTTAPRLYPNPVHGNTTALEFEKTSSAPWKIEVSNTVGQTVHSVEATEPAGAVRVEMAMPSSLPTGLYLYTIRNERGYRVHDGTIILTR